METSGIAERTGNKATADSSGLGVGSFRKGERAKMARTMERMLRVAKREARRRAAPGLLRLKWVNTVAYLTQTYNSLLRDTEVDELKEQMSVMREKMRKLTQSRYQQS